MTDQVQPLDIPSEVQNGIENKENSKVEGNEGEEKVFSHESGKASNPITSGL